MLNHNIPQDLDLGDYVLQLLMADQRITTEAHAYARDNCEFDVDGAMTDAQESYYYALLSWWYSGALARAIGKVEEET